MNKSFYLAALALFPLLTLAATAVTISNIVVESKTRGDVSDDMVRSNMTLQIGGEFSPEQLSEDIKKLYATRQFDDIEAKVDPDGADQVVILLTITPKPVIGKIIFKGNSLISSRKLRNQLDQKENVVLDEKQLAKDLESLYDLYRNKGYYDTVIKQNVQRLEDSHQVNVEYSVEEKARYKTRGVDIIGNLEFSDRELRRVMDTDVSVWGYVFPVGYFDDLALQTDVDKLGEAYQNRGYLDFRVDRVERFYNDDNDKIYLTIYIEEGGRYHVDSVTISGNTEFETNILAPLTTSQSGDVYSKERENRDVSAITDKYNRHGYLDCYVRVTRDVDSAANTVAITYGISEGRPYTIRDINISGNHVTKDNVIRRELKILPGDLGNSSKIEASKTSIQNLGYFESVDVTPLSTEEFDKKDLSIKVEEKLTGQLLFGAGFSSTDNLLGTVEVSQSNFDIKNFPSFRGGGQRFRLRAQLGSSRSDFVLSFTEPWLFDRPLRFDGEAWKRETTSNREYDQESVGFSTSLTRKMKRRFWRHSVGYRLEEIDINDFDLDFTPAFVRVEEGSELVSAFSLGFIRDHRDRQLFTSSGSRLSIRTELQGEFMGSYTNLYKLTLSGNKYYPIFKRSVLKLSGEIAQVQNVSGDEPRIFDRFFAGGARSIRGFKEREVGPVDPNNEEPIGGESMLLASAEVTMPIYQKTVFGAVFVDTGNVWEGATDWDPGELNIGIGTGLRLFLPIGAIQLDYGWPVSREYRHLGSGGRFHFNLGYNF